MDILFSFVQSALKSSVNLPLSKWSRSPLILRRSFPLWMSFPLEMSFPLRVSSPNLPSRSIWLDGSRLWECVRSADWCARITCVRIYNHFKGGRGTPKEITEVIYIWPWKLPSLWQTWHCPSQRLKLLKMFVSMLLG